MRKPVILSSCALALALTALAFQANGQIQVAGSLLVSIDPTGLPLGPISDVTNNGTVGGDFEATGTIPTGYPVIVTTAGGASGIMFDGNNYLQNVVAPGGAVIPLPSQLAGTNATYSIECWVLNPTTWTNDDETMVSWGLQGAAGNLTSFSYSAHPVHGAMNHSTTNADLNWLWLPALATWHHLAYTYDGTNSCLYADGVLNNAKSFTNNLVPDTNQPITLASERASSGLVLAAGGSHGSLTFGRVRIHSGVLTPAQVAANYAFEKPNFIMTPGYLSAAPIHRYGFNNTAATNAVGSTVSDTGLPGGATATVLGTAGNAVFSGSKIIMGGGSSSTNAYVSLPSGLLSSLDTNTGGSGQVTFEGWVYVAGKQFDVPIFDFGSTSAGQVTNVGGSFSVAQRFMLGQIIYQTNWARCDIANNGYNGGPNVTYERQFEFDGDNRLGYGMSHYAITWDETLGEVTIYLNGVEASCFSAPTKFNQINDLNAWLGRSETSNDANMEGTYDEFRIYNYTLSPSQVLNDYLAGPNTTNVAGGGLSAIHLTPPHTNLLVGAVDQEVVKGTFANISNVVIPPDATFTFTSGNTNVIEVSDTGYLQAVGPGSATLGVTVGAFSDNQTINVYTNPGTLTAVRLVVSNTMPLYGGQLVGIRGDYTTVTDVDLLWYAQPTLISLNTNVTVVTSSGLITAIAPGAPTITASYGGFSSSKMVTNVYPANRFIFDTYNDAFWAIINQANTNALVTYTNGSTQTVSTNVPADQQFEVLYNEENASFRLRNHTSWACIGAQSNGTNAGTKVVSITYSGAPSQQWYLIDVGGGYFRIVNGTNGLALQTDNGNPANVTLQPATNSPLQYWTFAYQTNYPKKGTAGYEGDYSIFTNYWAYNWGQTTGSTLPAQEAFDPMQWGVKNLSGGVLSGLTGTDYNNWHTTPKPTYLLGFNEPDHTDQANMTVGEAIVLWPQLQAVNLPLISAATANTFDSWMYSYTNLMEAAGYRMDYVTAHMYQAPQASGLIGNLQAVYNDYGRPVWLTEFSPVDWNNCQCWSWDDDFNGLAEFLWEAEDLPWLRHYSMYLFTGTNVSPNPWVDTGQEGNAFLSGTTLTPYGELYATWDADRVLHARTPYLIHNLGTSFRMTSSNSVAGPVASTIFVRNATTEWVLIPSVATNRWYIVSLSDGRRIQDSGGTLQFAPVGTTGASVTWTTSGPNSLGYYYLQNSAVAQNLNSSGSPPAINMNLTAAGTQNNNTSWRFIKPYQPVSLPGPASQPANPAAISTNLNVNLTWTGSGPYFDVYRSANQGGPYNQLAAGLTNTTFTDTNAANLIPYYYVIAGANMIGDESPYTTEVTATVDIAANWRQQWFGTRTNAGIAADSADPAGDGICNLLKRAFNLDPLVPATNGLPTGAISPDGSTYTLTYQESVAATDLTFQVLTSFDLASWSTGDVTDVVVSSDGVTAIHAASVPVEDVAQFLWLQVISPGGD